MTHHFHFLKRLRSAFGIAALALPLLAAAQSVDRLKQEALSIDQGAAALEAAHDLPLTIQVGTRAEGLVLRSVSVQIDNEPAVKYEFSDVEARALLNGGSYQLLSRKLPEGTHRLRADFLAREPSLRTNTPRSIAQLDATFTKQQAQQVIELDLISEGFLSKVAINKRESLVQSFAGGNQSEAGSRAANFLRDSGRDFGALPVSAGESALYAQYNAAVAAINGGQGAQGVALLNTIGITDVSDTDSLALRDQANVALGYYFLRSRQGESAIEVFNRVRSPGPFSTRALLGLGWALLAPSGSNRGAVTEAPTREKAAPGSAEERVAKNQTWPFKHMRTVATGDQLEEMRRALVPWTELVGRDPMDPAVQEGLLVMPYSLAHIGAYQQAHTSYLRAIDTLDRTRVRIEEAMQHVRSGGMVEAIDSRDRNTSSGWHWQLGDLPEPRWWLAGFPDAEPTFYLKHLLAGEGFLDAIEDYRDLHLLQEKLAAHALRLSEIGGPAAQSLSARIAAVRGGLDAAAIAARQQLQTVAVADLQKQKTRTEKYLVEAHLAIARNNDRIADENKKP